jgi:hypothetical protein
MLIAAFIYPVEKLIEPSRLAGILSDPNAKKPMIFNVGPSPMLPGAQHIGNVAEPDNKEKFKAMLSKVGKKDEFIIYCGCCKLEDCWNIHEADKLLTNLGYSNFKILNITTYFNKDWIEKKYPIK